MGWQTAPEKPREHDSYNNWIDPRTKPPRISINQNTYMCFVSELLKCGEESKYCFSKKLASLSTHFQGLTRRIPVVPIRSTTDGDLAILVWFGILVGVRKHETTDIKLLSCAVFVSGRNFSFGRWKKLGASDLCCVTIQIRGDFPFCRELPGVYLPSS